MMYGAAVIGLIVADRFLLKRNKVVIESVRKLGDEKLIRFAIDFRAKRDFISGKMTYSLRNKKRPTAVVTNERSLTFSKKGFNSEFLTFDMETLEKEAGEPIHGQAWVLDVKIERSCSRSNPLYKIFPTTAHYSEEFEIE